MRPLFCILLAAVFVKTLFHFTGIPLNLLTLLKDQSHQLHQTCLNSLDHLKHQSAQAHIAAQSLVCGKDLDDLSVRELFTQTGLVHLMVVSGSHLVLMNGIINSFLGLGVRLKNRLSPLAPIKLPAHFSIQIPFWAIRTSILFIYVLICACNPPVTRSFLALLIGSICENEKFKWTSGTHQWLTTLLCLIINPLWIVSLSFHMSTLASIELEIAKSIEDVRVRFFAKTALIYLGFIFIFAWLGFPHPLTPFYSALLSPIMEWILFPLSFLSLLGASASEPFVWVFSVSCELLKNLEVQSMSAILITRTQALYANIFLIGGLILFLLYFKPTKRLQADSEFRKLADPNLNSIQSKSFQKSDNSIKSL